MGKRAFPPLPIRPQLVAVYPALFALYSIYPSFQFSLSIGEAVDVRTEPESMLTPKHEFSLTDHLPVENAIVPWDLCRSISTSTSTDKSEIQEVNPSKTVASPPTAAIAG